MDRDHTELPVLLTDLVEDKSPIVVFLAGLYTLQEVVVIFSENQKVQ